jgi:predicted dehydrogenase
MRRHFQAAMTTHTGRIRVGLIGTGRVALANHVPGLALLPQVEVTALCDADAGTLAQAARTLPDARPFGSVADLIGSDTIDAVIIATPNHVHREIALAAIAAGKHVLCEKPLALTTADARDMERAAEAAGVRHMTAFTYRFVPAMRYMSHLVSSGALGTPRHFRAWRFQDWGRRALAWRQQQAKAGTGELGDMLSHRLDYAHLLLGPLAQVMAMTHRVWDTRLDAAGVSYPSDVEDWVAGVGTFVSGATGVFESTKTATGHGEGSDSEDLCEVNGTEGSVIYRLRDPLHVQIGRAGGRLAREAVPATWLKLPQSPRDPASGDPLQTFRYDQDVEFIQAILEQRPCEPSFRDGVRVQALMDAIIESAAQLRAVPVRYDETWQAPASQPASA